MSIAAPSRRALLATLLLGVPLAGALEAQRALLDSDSHGYTLETDGCASAFIDISASGSSLSFTASGAEDALDDGGAVLTLEEPFELYGVAHEALVVSSNGYLAAASSLSAEDGGDFSNDCSLPALPGNPAATAARLMPFHDDLAGDQSAGDVFEEYFASCPRSSETIGQESCTVIQWHDWALEGSAQTFDFEVVLYHQSQQATFLYGDLSGISIDSVSVGIQNSSASIGLAARCNLLGALSSDSALCFVDPRFPLGGPVADLAADLDDKTELLHTGGTVEYLLVIDNDGPSPVTAATVSLGVPAGLVECSWSCSHAESASCTGSSGSGALLDTPSLDPGGDLEYTFECTVSETAPDTLEVQATVSTPAGTGDPNASNDTAVDTDAVVATLFADDFEGGTTSSWSRTEP